MQEQETTQPVKSQEERIAELKKLIELKSVQAELQEINMKMAVFFYKEQEALLGLQKLKQQTQAPQEEVVNHTVTQQDLDNNPDMVEQGIKVGQVIGIPKNFYEQQMAAQRAQENTKPEENKKLKVTK